MEKPRMNVKDVMDDMRRRGYRIGYSGLLYGFALGLYPFMKLLNVSPNGRNNFLIMRKEYEAWADENIGGYLT